jgi:putative protein kinase ArgK-like GTPase of G3E family
MKTIFAIFAIFAVASMTFVSCGQSGEAVTATDTAVVVMDTTGTDSVVVDTILPAGAIAQ